MFAKALAGCRRPLGVSSRHRRRVARAAAAAASERWDKAEVITLFSRYSAGNSITEHHRFDIKEPLIQ